VLLLCAVALRCALRCYAERAHRVNAGVSVGLQGTTQAQAVKSGALWGHFGVFRRDTYKGKGHEGKRAEFAIFKKLAERAKRALFERSAERAKRALLSGDKLFERDQVKLVDVILNRDL
jgi:hypothetical protein